MRTSDDRHRNDDLDRVDSVLFREYRQASSNHCTLLMSVSSASHDGSDKRTHNHEGEEDQLRVETLKDDGDLQEEITLLDSFYRG